MPSSWTGSRDSARSLKDALEVALAKPKMSKPKQAEGDTPKTTAPKKAPQTKTKERPPMAPQLRTEQKNMMVMNQRINNSSR